VKCEKLNQCYWSVFIVSRPQANQRQ